MKIINQKDKGQSLVIVALMLFVLVGMVALIIDGGMAYSQRRAAQNAADAAALAGGQIYCATPTNTDGINAAVQEYAVTRNNATNATYSIGTEGLTVIATINYSSFLAGVLGHPTMTVNAQATAGCMSPCRATSVLPVAWACKPAAWYGEGGPTPTPDPHQCTTKMGTLTTPGPLYLIMDSFSSTDTGNGGKTPTPTSPGAQPIQDFYCQNPPNSGKPAGTLDCDTNNDGFDDVLPSSQRSWLALDGGNGSAADLIDWITNGYPGTIRPHDWLPQSSGVETSIFHSATLRINDIVLVPVFDEICQGDNPEVDCPSAWHDGDDINRRKSGTGQNYHIINYSPFKITCVDPSTIHPQPSCPAREAFIAQNPEAKKLKDTGSFKTIEGYFVKDYVPGLEGACGEGSSQYGAFTVYLK